MWYIFSYTEFFSWVGVFIKAIILNGKLDILKQSVGLVKIQVQFQFETEPVAPRVAVIFTDGDNGNNRRVPMPVTTDGVNVFAQGEYELPYVFYGYSPRKMSVSFCVSDGTDDGEIIDSELEVPIFKRKPLAHFIAGSSREKVKTSADIFLNIISLPFRILPVKHNRVSFMTNRTDELTGNIREVYKKLSEDKSLELKVLSKGGGVKSAVSMLFRFMYLYMTSRVVFVDDYFHLISFVKKKRETQLIQLWHACGVFKTFGFSRIHKDSKLKVSSANHRQYDYAVVSSPSVKDFYAEAFGISNEKVTALGSPRCDRLVDEEYKKAQKEKFYSCYPQLKNKKLLMFAPTFRGGGHGDCYFNKDDFNVDEVLEYLGEDWAVLIKLHPYLTEKFTCSEKNKDRMADCSQWDVNDVLFVTDFLVTDYSSVIFEASVLGIPMAFYATDLEEFIGSRDFYYDYLSFIPGKFFRNIKDVCKYISDGKYDMERIKAFKESAFGDTVGNAADNVSEFTHRIIERNDNS